MQIDFDVGKSGLSEQIAQRLETMILSDITQVAQKLPSEQTLAEGFGVSRPVVREALTMLKAKGLISQRQGGGSYIAMPDVRQMGDCVNRMVIMHHITFEEVYVARMTLELTIARLAVEHATDEAIAALREINERMNAAASDIALRVKIDLEFHTKLSEIAGNHMLSMFLQSLLSMLESMLGMALELPGAPEDGYRFHARIIDCLESGDGAAAQEIMRQHLMLSMRNYEVANA